MNEPHNPDDSWAIVELYRWQHGELPPNDGTCKPLDLEKGAMAMADALLESSEPGAMPTPYNAAKIIQFLARNSGKTFQAAREMFLVASQAKAQSKGKAMKVGRNDGSYCGSGIKMKKCCGRQGPRS